MKQPLPTLIVHGQKGLWYADVDGYAVHIPVLHYELIGPGGLPWPTTMQFLKGDVYDQPCNANNWVEKASQAKRANQLKCVVMTRDFWSHPPGTRGKGVLRERLKSDGYVGLFQISNAHFHTRDGGHLCFVLGVQKAHLMRPCDLR